MNTKTTELQTHCRSSKGLVVPHSNRTLIKASIAEHGTEQEHAAKVLLPQLQTEVREPCPN